MSAVRQVTENFADVMQAGAAVPELVKPGQVDPRATHYGYSAGERELQVRAADIGHSSILPGLLVPLQAFRKSVPNDTMEALMDEKAPASIRVEVTPRDAADALMSRYQHRGFRILMPLVGMDMVRAAKLFRIVHPRMECKQKPARLSKFEDQILARHCVACRLDDLRSDASLDRIAAAKPSVEPTIEFGFLDETEAVRHISEEEALTYVHEMILGALDEHYSHMIDTLIQSDADIKAGRSGPGKKAWDKRDKWYFLMSHQTPETIGVMAGAERGTDRGGDVASALREGFETLRTPRPQADVEKLLAEQEKRFQLRLEEQAKQLRKELAQQKTKAGKDETKSDA